MIKKNLRKNIFLFFVLIFFSYNYILAIKGDDQKEELLCNASTSKNINISTSSQVDIIPLKTLNIPKKSNNKLQKLKINDIDSYDLIFEQSEYQ